MKRVKVRAGSSQRFNITNVARHYRQLPIDLLRPSKFQTRKYFSKSKLNGLAKTLQEAGTNTSALIVRPIAGTQGYEIISGERRWRAAQEIQMESLLCEIGDFNDDQALYIAAIENLQRDDLNPIEEAESYKLMLGAGDTHQSIADEIGKSRAHVTNYLRLLNLPLAIRDLIGQEKLSYAQVRPICGLSIPGQQTNIAKEAVARGWTSARVAQEVSKLQSSRKLQPRRLDESADVNLTKLHDLISEQTGYTCAIERSSRGGWKIAFGVSSTEEFQGVLERLGINTDQF